jgi:hypothetical protein
VGALLVHLQDGSEIDAVEANTRECRAPHIFARSDVSASGCSSRKTTVLQKPYFALDLQLAIRSAPGAAEAS